jgi:hypothetical protein
MRVDIAGASPPLDILAFYNPPRFNVNVIGMISDFNIPIGELIGLGVFVHGDEAIQRICLARPAFYPSLGQVPPQATLGSKAGYSKSLGQGKTCTSLCPLGGGMYNDARKSSKGV